MPFILKSSFHFSFDTSYFLPHLVAATCIMRLWTLCLSLIAFTIAVLLDGQCSTPIPDYVTLKLERFSWLL